MPTTSRLATATYFFMLFLGGATLAAALLLPAWREYDEALARHAAAVARQAALDAEIARLEKQIEHLQHDPDYLARVARHIINTDRDPEKTVLIVPADDQTSTLTEPVPAPRSSRLINWQHPLATVFMQPASRRAAILMAATLVLTSLIFLWRDYRHTLNENPLPPPPQRPG